MSNLQITRQNPVVFVGQKIHATIKLGLEILRQICQRIAHLFPLHQNNTLANVTVTPIPRFSIPASERTSEDKSDPIENMLKNFNDFFPNVVVVGGVETPEGKETLQQLDKLGIKYRTQGPYNASQVPHKVWSRLHSEVDLEIKQTLINKLDSNQDLTAEEALALKKLKGATACFMLHRDVIMQTIQRYNDALADIERLKIKPESDQKKKQLEEALANKEKYDSLFIFEHNARFGFVDENNQVSVSPKIKEVVENTLNALPKDWELFNLFCFELWSASARVPDDIPTPSTPALVYPGAGMSMKAVAISSRFYSDLETLFKKVTEKDASIDFHPIDAHLYACSRDSCKQNPMSRRFQLASAKPMIYRAAGPSFHANHHDKNSYAFKHLRGADYTTQSYPVVSRQEQGQLL